MKLRFDRHGAAVFILLALNLFAMLALSWRKWADIWIDYGREAYSAWLLSMGKPLYTSVDCLYGPLANYTHALVFKIFGPGLLYLSLWNILLAIVFSALVYHFIVRYAGRVPAALCVAAFYTIFAFSQYTFMGSLNFVCPYTYSMTYGVMLAVLCCFALCLYFETGLRRHLLLAGFLCGLVFLTKAEALLAAGGASAATFAVFEARDWRKKPWSPQPYVLFCAAALLPGLAAVLLLSMQMPIAAALNGVLFQYKALLSKGLPATYHYGSAMGISAVGTNLLIMGRCLFFYLLVAAAGFLAAKAGEGLAEKKLRLAAILFALLLSVFAGSRLLMLVQWHNALRGLPAALLLLCVFYSIRLFRCLRMPGAACAKDFMRWLLCVFSLLLLAKVILNVWLGHYAFALAVPGTFLLIVFLAEDAPHKTPGVSGREIAVTVVCGLLLLAFAGFARNSAYVYKAKTYQVAAGADAVLDYSPRDFSRGYVMNSALDFISRRLSPSDTFATLPAGAMLNYLSRHESNYKYIVLLDAELALHGPAMADELFKARPDYVFVVNYPGWFETDFGKALYARVTREYNPVAMLGLERGGRLKNDHLVMALVRGAADKSGSAVPNGGAARLKKQPQQQGGGKQQQGVGVKR